MSALGRSVKLSWREVSILVFTLVFFASLIWLVVSLVARSVSLVAIFGLVVSLVFAASGLWKRPSHVAGGER